MQQEYNFITRPTGTTAPATTFLLEINGTPADLTGASIIAKFRRWNELKKIQETFTVGSGITITNAVGGIFQIDEYEMDWKPNTYYYDIDIVFASGVKKNYIKGKWVITENID